MTGEVKILKKALDEDIAACVADLRREFNGNFTTSVEWGGARYSEPLSDEYYTVIGQIEDINRAIETCKRKLRRK